MSSRDRSPAPGTPGPGRYRTDVNGGAQSLAGRSVAALADLAEPTTEGWDRASQAGARAVATVNRIEKRAIELAVQWFEPAARIAIFIIYFWFGFLKLIGVSPATPLASALTAHTIGMQYFTLSFKALAVYECGLGILFLFRPMTRVALVLLVIHMGIVSSPLVIVASVAWTHPLVPTLEGQYIIKDLAIIALGIGILAQMRAPKAIRRQSALTSL